MPYADGLAITTLASCEDGAVLRVSGELDHGSEGVFRVTVGACVGAGYRYLTLDCSALTFCDSRGLNCLLGLHWLLRRRQGRLLLACVGRRVRQLLDQTGSGELLPVFTSVTQALATLPEGHRPVWPPDTARRRPAAQGPA